MFSRSRAIQQLHIPQPCNRTWRDMHDTEGGKHCTQCQKIVADFSHMSDRQLQSFFHAHTGKSLCGRFRTDQIDRDLTHEKKARQTFWNKFIFAALSFGFINSTYAKTKPILSTSIIHETAHPEKKQESHSTETRNTIKQDSIKTVRVHVVDRDTKEAISGVDVFHSDTTFITKTDTNGYFELPLDAVRHEPVTLFLRYIGYDNKTVNLKPSDFCKACSTKTLY